MAADSVDQEQIDSVRDRFGGVLAQPAVRGRVPWCFTIRRYVTEADQSGSRGRPWPTPQTPRVLDQVAGELEGKQVQQGQKQPLAGYGAEAATPTAGAAAQRRHPAMATPTFLAWICWGAAGYSLRPSGPTERTAGADRSG